MSSNKLILGTVQMGIPYGINNTSGKITFDDSIKILKKAYSSNINIIDTAEVYGNAHSIIGEYHKINPSNKFKIITKFPHSFTGSLKEKVNHYIKELYTDTLFAILFHSYSSYRDNTHNIHELIQLKKDKLIEKIGVSVYTNEEIEEVIQDINIDIIQLPFNVFDNKNQRGDIIQKIKKTGKIIHTRSCFLQGLFFTSPQTKTPLTTQLKTELNKLRSISQSNGISIQQTALNYCLQEQLIDNVLIGVDSLDQLNHNIEFSSKTISPEIIEEINSIKINNKNLLNPSLWNKL